jgi:hypothetical protein
MSLIPKRTFGWLLVGVLAAVVVVGVSLLFYGPQKDKIVAPGDLTVVRSSTGGLEGGGDGQDLRITPEGKVVADGSEKTLPKGEMQKLAERIEDIGFFTLNSSYPEDFQCADAFISKITVTQNAQTKTVTFEQCEPENTPPQLLDFDKYLLDLAEF